MNAILWKKVASSQTSWLGRACCFLGAALGLLITSPNGAWAKAQAGVADLRLEAASKRLSSDDLQRTTRTYLAKRTRNSKSILEGELASIDQQLDLLYTQYRSNRPSLAGPLTVAVLGMVITMFGAMFVGIVYPLSGGLFSNSSSKVEWLIAGLVGMGLGLSMTIGGWVWFGRVKRLGRGLAHQIRALKRRRSAVVEQLVRRQRRSSTSILHLPKIVGRGFCISF